VTDAARDADGNWRINRRVLAAGAVVLGIGVVAVFPLRLLPSPWFADSILHLSSGIALTLGLSAIVPRRDDVLALAVIVLGIVWEPVEAIHFGTETLSGMIDWLSGNDTLKDMSLVTVGALVALVGTGRYE